MNTLILPGRTVGALDWLPPHPDLGRLYLPELFKTISRPGSATRPATRLSEIGIVVATLKRPEYDDNGVLKRLRLIWHSITHNERVDVGAAIQANRVFGTAGTTAVGVITTIAVANGTFTTKTKTDLSIGLAGADLTTNEFTTIGLSRTLGTVGTYTAPSTLGGQFSQVLSKAFAVSGSGTAHGSAVYDSTTVVGSHLHVEDTFASDAIVVNGDSLTVQWTISN